MVNKEQVKRKIIKRNKLKTVADTEKLIARYLDKMNYERLLYTKDYVEKNILKDGKTDANLLFLKLVEERLKKYDEKQ